MNLRPPEAAGWPWDLIDWNEFHLFDIHKGGFHTEGFELKAGFASNFQGDFSEFESFVAAPAAGGGDKRR